MWVGEPWGSVGTNGLACAVVWWLVAQPYLDN
jgi:hypothetical protein